MRDRRAIRRAMDEAIVLALEEAARIAEEPYADPVRAMGADEPVIVGRKIAHAIRAMAGDFALDNEPNPGDVIRRELERDPMNDLPPFPRVTP